MIGRLFWLGVLGVCAVVKFLATWVEEHASARLKGKPDGDPT